MSNITSTAATTPISKFDKLKTQFRAFALHLIPIVANSTQKHNWVLKITHCHIFGIAYWW